MAANQPILLSKFAQGIVGPTTQQIVLQGQIDGPNDGAGDPLGGVGSFNYTIDGATNAGNNRRMAASPNSDLIQEMRVETSNFDASQGHGTGANISLMTRAGTNLTRGTVNYQYWTNQINSLNPQQKLAFGQRPETGELYNTGHSHNVAFTLGGPVVLPKMVNGRNKLFYFFNYQRNYDDSAARNTPTIDGAGEREAPRRRLLGSADPGHARPVSDLRSADRASRSGASGQLHPHAVPEQHHPEGPVHERERHLQEPAVRALQGHDSGAEPELRRAGSRFRPATTIRAACRT